MLRSTVCVGCLEVFFNQRVKNKYFKCVSLGSSEFARTRVKLLREKICSSERMSSPPSLGGAGGQAMGLTRVRKGGWGV